MARFQWMNGNQGIARYTEFGDFDIIDAGPNRILMEYHGIYGEFNPTQSPWRINLTLKNAESYVPDSGPRAGETVYTAGTISKIRYLSDDGEVLLKVTGLDVSLPAFSTYVTNDVTYALFDVLASGGHEFVGSNNAMGRDQANTGDDISTGDGDDVIQARGGDDYIRDAGGSDIYKGGRGYDSISYDQWYWNPTGALTGIDANLETGVVIGPDGTEDVIKGFEALHGSFLADRIIGNKANNFLLGMQGADEIDGGRGFDRVSYRNDRQQGGTDGIVVDLRAGTIRDGFGTVDTVRRIESVVGTDYGDLFIDDDRDSRFRGHVGQDEFRSGKGDDILEGGEDADLFVFRGTEFGVDKISDFSQAEGDKIKITQAASFDDISLEDEGANIEIYFGNGIVILSGYRFENPGDLTADDFIF